MDDYIDLTEAAQLLDLEPAEIYLLVRTGEIPGIKLGGRGQWRCAVATRWSTSAAYSAVLLGHLEVP